MQYKIFSISLLDEDRVEDMNRFLRGTKVVHVEKQLITVSEGTFWTFCIQYIGTDMKTDRPFGDPKAKVDYKQILDESTFAKFSKMRECRKQLADSDAVPAYAVFTDAELSEIAKLSELTEKALRSIPGIGAKKVEKYGKQLCDLMAKSEPGTLSETLF